MRNKETEQSPLHRGPGSVRVSPTHMSHDSRQVINEKLYSRDSLTVKRPVNKLNVTYVNESHWRHSTSEKFTLASLLFWQFYLFYSRILRKRRLFLETSKHK